MQGSEVQPVPAVVANANHIMALSVARSLGRENIPVIAVFGENPEPGPFNRTVGYSRYVREKFFFDEQDYANSLVDCLKKLAERIGRKSVLFPASDQDMITISGLRKSLEPYYHLLMPNHEVLDTLLNKQKFYPYAQEQGIPIPKTFCITSDSDIETCCHNLKYPCIIKPPWRDREWIRVHKSRKVILSDNPGDMISRCRETLKRFEVFTVQEVIEGPEENILCSFAFLDEDSTPLGISVCRKIRQYPPFFGNTTLAESIIAPEIESLTESICRKNKYVGYISIEFKKDMCDKSCKVIEITPGRLNRQAGISDPSGLNIPLLWYSHLTGRPFEAGPPIETGSKWISEVNELRAIPSYLRAGGLDPVQWLKSYKSLNRSELFSSDDLAPLLKTLQSAATRGRKIKRGS